MKHVISVEGLSKSYNDATVVDDISFAVSKGEVFGILGPNGAGKTTTLEMMEGLRPIDKGSVVIGDIDVAQHPNKVKKIIGVQRQTSGFFENIRLIEMLNMFAGLYGKSVDARKLLEEVDLQEKARAFVQELSGGQRQRFSIATALVNNPTVLFLDEPTTGLDPQARRNLWDLIVTIKSKGITVILTSHYMEEAEILCDRVAIMDEGKIKVIDTPKKLIKALLDRGFSKPQETQKANLEDVFIDLTGKELRE